MGPTGEKSHPVFRDIGNDFTLVWVEPDRGLGGTGQAYPRTLFGDDFLGWWVPDEGFGVLVPVVGPGVDGVDELVDAGETVPA